MRGKDDFDQPPKISKYDSKHVKDEHYKAVKRHQAPFLLRFLTKVNPSLDLVNDKIYHSLIKKAIVSFSQQIYRILTHFLDPDIESRSQHQEQKFS